MINSTKIKNLFSLIVRPKPDLCPAPVSETTREGTGVSPGIVIGRVYVFDSALKSVPFYHVPRDEIVQEQERFNQAIEKTTKQLDQTMDKAKNALANDALGSLLDAYRHMLQSSRLTRGVRERIEKDRINAEAAVLDEVAAIADVFAAMQDSYISSRVEDIRNIGMRLIRNLQTDAPDNLNQMPENAVVVARDLSAADTAMLNMRKIAGLITVNGSAQSHTALLARSLGLPAIVNIPDLMQIATTGDVIIIDGAYGKVILNPTQDNVELYRKYRTDFLRWKRSLTRLRDQPSLTADNVYIRLKGNIDLPNELDFLMQTGVDGVGLLRSEYMYLNRSDLPDEDEQYALLKSISEKIEGKPVTFRTIDAGADKGSPIPESCNAVNPALGLRGIRYMRLYEQLITDQFRAALRAAATADIRLLLPMVSSVDEVIQARKLLERCAAELRAEGKEIPDVLPPLGVMIEVPSAAMEADTLAEYCDFFSIGTNDLIQYTMAVDRTDATVSSLFNPLNPAVLKLLKTTIDAANAHNIPVSICGEMAANYHYSALLIGLGVRELSMPAVNIPMVKERLRSLTTGDTERFANHILTLHYPADVAAAMTAFEEGQRF